MTPPRIDLRTFEALQANAGADFVVTLVEAFAEESPQLVADLRASAVAGDGEAFETAAHTLKCNSVTFGADGLAEMARRLEWQGRSAGAASAVDALAAELASTVAVLRELARG